MIGIFDSGIGGLTVVRELLRQAPDAAFVYLGDSARAPYGNKSSETLRRYAEEDAAFLIRRGATAIVIACNSASAAAAEHLRLRHPSLPVFDVIQPAIEDALTVTRGRIGVIGTRATIGSGVYQRRLNERAPHAEVLSIACPLLVPLVEEGWLEDAETKRILRRYLAPLRQAKVDTLILGCTHYPLLAPLIARFMGNRVRIIDSGAAVVARVTDHLSPGPQSFYLTDVSPQSDAVALRWLGRPVKFLRAE